MTIEEFFVSVQSWFSSGLMTLAAGNQILPKSKFTDCAQLDR